jgi:acetolactate synthase-1/2/3 large subunit
MAAISAARYLAGTLEAYGVTHVFFVPTILSRTLAEMEQHTHIERILTHGEKAAAYMADGYARACGRPGLCLAQAIGASNLASGLRDAYLAHSPVIAITGSAKPETRNRTTYQQVQDAEQFRAVTKWIGHLEHAAELPQALRQAFRVATTGAPGPVHLELAGHTGELEDEQGNLLIEAEPQFGHVPPFRPHADRASLAEALRRMHAAARPMFVAGGGCKQSGAGPALLALAERLTIPIATSLNAKEIVPADHPLNVGVVGTYSRKSANQSLHEADLVIFVGSGTGSQVTCFWNLPAQGTPIIQIDIEPQELGRHYPRTLGILADARTALEGLLELVDGTPPDRRAWVARVAALRESWLNEVADLTGSDASPLRPERLCRDLGRYLPHDSLVVVDTGHSGMWTGGFLDLTRPGQGYIRAAGSLGWGLPAALGAKLAQPDRPVILFSGDGGFWYHLAELETAVRWGIDVVLLINNNQSLNQERDIYRTAYGGDLHGRHTELWHFSHVSFTAIAESMGARGIRVERPADLDGALERAFAGRGPCVVEVLSDPEAVAPLAWTAS